MAFFEYAKEKREVPYWLYRLSEDMVCTKFVVFENRLWFVTDYVVPILNGKAISARDAANPANKPTLAAVLIRQPQGGRGVIFEYSWQHIPDEPIFVGSDDIPSKKMLHEQYAEYLDATERWLLEPHIEEWNND